MRYRLLIITLGLLLGLRVNAQDTPADLPPVLDPATIFAEGIQVVETLPVLHSADEDGLIYYLPADADSWQTLSLPAEADQYYFDERLSPDGTFLITGSSGLLSPSQFPPIYIRFDPVTEHFTRLRGRCGHDEDGTEQWVFEKNRDDSFQFCNTTTGQRTNPLPKEIEQSICQNYLNYAISPDKLWAIFFTCKKGDPTINGFTIYAYEMATGLYHELGRTNGHESIGVTRWIDDNTPIFFGSALATQNNRSLYIAKMMLPNSLKLIAESYISYPIYYDDPPHYVWINRAFEDITITDEDGTEGGGSALRSKIYQFNLQTRRQETLLPDIAPCQYYISECVALTNAPSPTLIVVFERVIQTEYTVLRVYEADGTMIFETTGNWYISSTGAYKWFDDKLLYQISNYSKDGYSAQLLDFSVQPPRMIEIPGDISSFSPAISSDGRAIISQRVGDFLTLSLYDLHTNQITPLTKLIDTTLYDIDAYWKDDNHIAVTVYDKVRSCCNEQFPLRDWIVRPPIDR